MDALITTIITSTAALTAIIGGFLVSRVITLSSEQNGINRKIRELTNEIDAKQDMLNEVTNYIIRDDAFNFIIDNVDDLSTSDLPLEEIHKNDQYKELSINQLEPFVKKFRSIYKELFALMKGSNTLPRDFNDFRKSLKAELSKPDILDYYDLAYDNIFDSLSKDTSSSNIHFPQLGFLSIQGKVRTDSYYYHEQVKIKEQLESELVILNLQQKEQEKILSDFGKPVGVWSGLFVIIYSGIVGIACPVTLLPYPAQQYDDSRVRVFLIALFLSELLVLFGYLILAMKKLTKNDRKE